MLVYTIFLANSFAWQNNCRIANYYVDIINTMPSGPAIVLYSTNLSIDWKFGNKLILYISTELCHEITMLKSQNGPL